MTNKRENNPDYFNEKKKKRFTFFYSLLQLYRPPAASTKFLCLFLSSLGLEGFDEVDILDPLRLDKPLRVGQDVMLVNGHVLLVDGVAPVPELCSQKIAEGGCRDTIQKICFDRDPSADVVQGGRREWQTSQEERGHHSVKLGLKVVSLLVHDVHAPLDPGVHGVLVLCRLAHFSKFSCRSESSNI